MKKFTCILFTALLTSFNLVTAQITITIKPPQGALDDASIATSFASSNFGNHAEELAMSWTCSGNPCVSRCLLNFDLSSIPANSIINTASLYLYADINNAGQNGNPGQPTYGTNNAGLVSRINQSWNEFTVTWNNQPSVDVLNQVSIPQSTSVAEDYIINVSSIVQDMINNPAASFGFLVQEQDEINYFNSLIFVSNDNSDTARAPKLVVTYTANTGTFVCTEMIMDAAGTDATISTSDVNGNYPNHTEELAMTWSCSGNPCLGRSLLEFDLTSIPANAVIDSAYLKLYADLNNAGQNGIPGQPTYGSDNAGFVSRITQSWTENSVTWNNQPATTLQNQVVIPQSVSGAENYVLDVTSMVQDMINNPASSYGFLLREQNEITYYNSLIFASGDAADANAHPRLKICYTIPAGIVETANDNSLNIFPNPASNQLTITNPRFAIESIVVFDMLGQKVYSERPTNINHQLTVNVSELSSGIYFVKVKGEKEERVVKFVKQ